MISKATNHVLDASFSSDGRRIITASHDQTARVWDAETGAALLVLRGHEHRVAAAVFDPRGKRVMTASWDGTARLWDAETGRSLAVLSRHAGFVDAVAFSADGERAVTAGTDKSARLWDAATGNLIATLQGHSGAVRRSYSARTASDSSPHRMTGRRDFLRMSKLQSHRRPCRTRQGRHDRNVQRVGDVLVTGSMTTPPRLAYSPHQPLSILPGHRQSLPDTGRRKQFFLAVEPPRWCITGPSREQVTDIATWNGKPPYRAQEWTQWLAATDAAREGQSAHKFPCPRGQLISRPCARPNPFLTGKKLMTRHAGDAASRASFRLIVDSSYLR
jgi:hypothetical protein